MIEFDGPEGGTHGNRVVQKLVEDFGAVQIQLPERVEEIHTRFMAGGKLTQKERDEHRLFFDNVDRSFPRYHICR